MSDKILYRIKDGKLISTPVIREDAGGYWIDDYNFSGAHNIYPENANLSPEEAFDDEYRTALGQVNTVTTMLTRASDRLRTVVKMIQVFESK
jgi:hypothetical protein